MALSDVFAVGEQLLALQPQVAHAQQHHPKAAHTGLLLQQAAKLTKDFIRLVDPATLLPQIRSLGQDAARYQFLRNEATPEEWAMALAHSDPKERDAYLDTLIEEAFVSQSADQLTLALNTEQGNG